jgi:hypothetical protein
MVKLLSLGGDIHSISASCMFSRVKKALKAQKRRQLEMLCLLNMNGKLGSAYDLVLLRPLGDTTWYCFPLSDRSCNMNNLEEVEDSNI